MRVLAAFFLALPLVSCSVPPPSPAVNSPARPVFSEAEIRRHVSQFLLRSESAALPIDHRRSIENYVSARMHEFNMQPALGARYVIPYHLAEQHPLVLTVRTADPEGRPAANDGIRLLPQSAGGHVSFRSVIVNPNPEDDLAGSVVAIAGDQVVEATLARLHEAGASGVIVAGSVGAAPAGGPIPDVIVVQGSRADVANLLGIDRQRLISHLSAPESQLVQMPGRVSLQVARDYSRRAPKANLLGLVAGKVPDAAAELVIVCAEYNGPTAPGGREAGAALVGAAGAAAVLELGRKYGAFARFGTFPERTVMFALWSGARMNHAGLRTYLDSPAWLPDQVRHVIWLGATEESATEIEALLSGAGYSVTMINRTTPAPSNGTGRAAAESAEALRIATDAARLLYREARNSANRSATPYRPAL